MNFDPVKNAFLIIISQEKLIQNLRIILLLHQKLFKLNPLATPFMKKEEEKIYLRK